MGKGRFLVRNCQKEELPRFIEILKATNLLWEKGDTEKAFQKKLEHDPESILVLEREGKIIGAVMFIYDPWVSTVWHLTIDPSFQGQGLGNLLAEEAERRLNQRGTKIIQALIMPTNEHSRHFFKKRGFKEIPSLVVVAGKSIHNIDP